MIAKRPHVYYEMGRTRIRSNRNSSDVHVVTRDEQQELLNAKSRNDGIEPKVDDVTNATQRTWSAVESIATFTFTARPERLTLEMRYLLKQNFPDKIAYVVPAFESAVRRVREQLDEYRASGLCKQIENCKTLLD